MTDADKENQMCIDCGKTGCTENGRCYTCFENWLDEQPDSDHESKDAYNSDRGSSIPSNSTGDYYG